MRITLLTGLLASLVAAGCGESTSRSPVTTPGDEASVRTRALEAGAAMLQKLPPIQAVAAYLDGFHFYSGRPDAQMEAHHYCSILNDEVIQCVIFDGNVSDARIMGVEYIISAKLFATLPRSEKALWHSHVHEVKSGQLIAPGIPEVAEHELMDKLVSTYGKTWHTWHTDLNKELPVGVPQLMMGFTGDGQADEAMVAARDRRFGIESAVRRRKREDIATPAIDPLADGWRHGQAIQIDDPTEQSAGTGHGPGHPDDRVPPDRSPPAASGQSDQRRDEGRSEGRSQGRPPPGR